MGGVGRGGQRIGTALGSGCPDISAPLNTPQTTAHPLPMLNSIAADPHPPTHPPTHPPVLLDFHASKLGEGDGVAVALALDAPARRGGAGEAAGGGVLVGEDGWQAGDSSLAASALNQQVPRYRQVPETGSQVVLVVVGHKGLHNEAVDAAHRAVHVDDLGGADGQQV